MQDSTNPYAPSQPSAPLEAASMPPLAPPQTVRYAQSAESLAAWSYHRSLRSPYDNASRRNARRWIIMTMAAIGAFVIWHMWLVRDASVASRLIPGFVGLVFFLRLWSIAARITDNTALLSAHRTQFEAYMKEGPNRNYRALQTTTIDESGLRIEKELEQSILAWPAIELIEQTEDYLFLYVASFVAEIIPRSAFATQEEFLGFANLARQLWEEHRGDVGAPEAEQPAAIRDV